MDGCNVHQLSLNIDNLEDRRLIWSLLVRSMDADGLAAWFAKILLLGLLNSEGQQVVSALV